MQAQPLVSRHREKGKGSGRAARSSSCPQDAFHQNRLLHSFPQHLLLQICHNWQKPWRGYSPSDPGHLKWEQKGKSNRITDRPAGLGCIGGLERSGYFRATATGARNPATRIYLPGEFLLSRWLNYETLSNIFELENLQMEMVWFWK